MFVRYWMSRSPKMISEEKNLADAFQLMRDYKIRRLPVTKNGKLSGMIADTDLFRIAGPRLSTLENFPESVLKDLKKVTVGTSMTSPALSCDPNMPIEDAADLMRRHKIGAIPVVDKEQIVGIITESDVLEAFAKIALSGSEGKRVCFRVSPHEKISAFYEIMELSMMNEVEILTVLTHPLRNEDAELVMIRFKGSRTDDFLHALRQKKYQLLG